MWEFLFSVTNVFLIVHEFIGFPAIRIEMRMRSNSEHLERHIHNTKTHNSHFHISPFNRFDIRLLFQTRNCKPKIIEI